MGKDDRQTNITELRIIKYRKESKFVSVLVCFSLQIFPFWDGRWIHIWLNVAENVLRLKWEGKRRRINIQHLVGWAQHRILATELGTEGSRSENSIDVNFEIRVVLKKKEKRNLITLSQSGVPPNSSNSRKHSLPSLITHGRDLGHLTHLFLDRP
jgi:hypothetical protein